MSAMSNNSSFVAIRGNTFSEKVRYDALEESYGNMQSGHTCSGVVSVSIYIGVSGDRYTTEASVLCCAAGNASSGKIQQQILNIHLVILITSTRMPVIVVTILMGIWIPYNLQYRMRRIVTAMRR